MQWSLSPTQLINWQVWRHNPQISSCTKHTQPANNHSAQPHHLSNKKRRKKKREGGREGKKSEEGGGGGGGGEEECRQMGGCEAGKCFPTCWLKLNPPREKKKEKKVVPGRVGVGRGGDFSTEAPTSSWPTARHWISLTSPCTRPVPAGLADPLAARYWPRCCKMPTQLLHGCWPSCCKGLTQLLYGSWSSCCIRIEPNLIMVLTKMLYQCWPKCCIIGADPAVESVLAKMYWHWPQSCIEANPKVVLVLIQLLRGCSPEDTQTHQVFVPALGHRLTALQYTHVEAREKSPHHTKSFIHVSGVLESGVLVSPSWKNSLPQFDSSVSVHFFRQDSLFCLASLLSLFWSTSRSGYSTFLFCGGPSHCSFHWRRGAGGVSLVSTGRVSFWRACRARAASTLWGTGGAWADSRRPREGLAQAGVHLGLWGLHTANQQCVSNKDNHHHQHLVIINMSITIIIVLPIFTFLFLLFLSSLIPLSPITILLFLLLLFHIKHIQGLKKRCKHKSVHALWT